jgi:hypothetical protein
LDKYEQLVVKPRIKDCESALDALRRRQEGKTFDRDQLKSYTLTNLNDLAGVRVLAFPRTRLTEIDQILHNQFASWTADPVPGYSEKEGPLAFKYFAYCKKASKTVRGEFQIVSMLIGLYWEVEHSAIYKPTPRLKGVARRRSMQQRDQEVINSLRAFEEEFENLIRQDQLENEKNNR